MQADAVLQSMVDSLVSAYNEGRDINVARYDEIVALYAMMLSSTETELNAIMETEPDMDVAFDDINTRIENALARYGNVADSLPSDWNQSRIADINLKFDNLISESRAKMVADGTYNGTVWPTTEAGIERQRAYALNNLKDEMVTLKLDAYGKIATITASVGEQLINAQVRIFEALRKKRLDPVDLRNTVFKWMLDFMERRTDEYPALAELPTIAERLGYDGGIVAPNRARA
jgi:ATP-dependent Clp protease ATP-binding subunit ClpA